MKATGLVCAAFMALASVPAAAECMAPGALSSDFMLYFSSDPKTLLELFPQGSRAMSGKVAEIAEASSKMEGALRLVIGSSNEAQAMAIGAGLARAARECKPDAGEWSNKIAEIALRGGNQTVARAFADSSDGDDDVQATTATVDDASRHHFVPGVSLSLDDKQLPNPFAPLKVQK